MTNRDIQRKKSQHERELMALAYDVSFQNFLSLGKIATGLIHDLINPVMALRFHMETLEKHSSRYLSEDDWYHLEQSMRILRTMDEYICIARDAMQLKNIHEKFAVAEEIKKTCQLLTNAFLSAKIVLYIQCDTEFYIVGNRTKFNRMLMNILSNAIDAYESINESTDEKKILVRMQKYSDNTLALHITDYGIGISVEQVDNIFEPFFTTKKSHKGMGIGLFMVKEVMEKDFEGSVSIESVLGEGTTCTLLFPQKDHA